MSRSFSNVHLANIKKIPGLKEMFPKLVQECLKSFNENGNIPEFVCHEYKKLLEFNEPHIPYADGAITVPTFFKILKPAASDDETELSMVLGWCFHLVQNYSLMLDDFVDGGEYRNEKSTWTKLHDSNPGIVVYDCLLLQSTMYAILRQHFHRFGSKYTALLELFLETNHKAWKGYRWEVSQVFGNGNRQHFNWQSYYQIARLKFGWLFFHLPVASAMILAGYDKYDTNNIELYSNVLKVCCDLGEYGVLLNDFTDAFPRNSKCDTLDTDIRQGELTWLFLTALESCKTDEQLTILKTEYGRDDDKSVNAIKLLYVQMELPQKCKQAMKEKYNGIEESIKEMFSQNPKVAEMLQTLLAYTLKLMDF